MARKLDPATVRAEPVEALSFFCAIGQEEGQPFDKLRANGFFGIVAF
jgi:hypothetical protein